MDLLESDTIPFVINIWIEETTQAGRVVWRGYIIHVPSSERHHLKNLDDISVFIRPYLREMGVGFGVRWRMRQWLKYLLKRMFE